MVNPFTDYTFIEKNSNRVQKLHELKQEFSNRKIEIYPGECNNYLQSSLISHSAEYWTDRRALIFLDPFGMQVAWTTIEAVAKTKAIDLWVLFPLDEPDTAWRLFPCFL